VAALAVRIIASTEIARAVCLGDFFRAAEHIKAQTLWEAKIHDAGVSFFTTDRVLDKASAQNLVRSAQSDATQLTQAASSARSFAFGKCPTATPEIGKKSDVKSWLALFSSPKQAEVTEKDLRLPRFTTCKETIVRWISAWQGTSIKLTPDSNQKFQIPSDDGLISVTCSHDVKGLPPAANGPELWFSIPTGKGPSAIPPGNVADNVQAENFSTQLFQWINRIRALEKLKPLEKLDLPGVPDLTRNRSPLHDRKLLQQVSEHARVARNYAFQGENRVVARNIADAAWLLWNSPRHRDLLLDSRARFGLLQFYSDSGSGQITASILLFSPSVNDRR
jgi:hypothetical protein